MKKSLTILLLLVSTLIVAQGKIKQVKPPLNKSIVTVKNFSFHPDFKECYVVQDGKLYPFKVISIVDMYGGNTLQTYTVKVDNLNKPILSTGFTESIGENPYFYIMIKGDYTVDGKKVTKYFNFKYYDKDLFVMMKSLIENYDKKGKLILQWTDSNKVQIGDDIQLGNNTIKKKYYTPNPGIIYLPPGGNLQVLGIN